jgi:hypothetical protein
MHSSTTIFISVEHVTCTPASYDLSIGLKGELRRAILPQISIAPDGAAIAFTIKSFDNHWQIKAIYKANVIEIDISKAKLCNGGRRVTRASAIEGGATVAGLACAVAIFVEIATGSGPYAATPPG